MSRNTDLGRLGEDLACQYLQGLGFLLRGRNIRIGTHDEIDILAFDPEDRVLVFVEVKTRSRSDEYFRPEMNIDYRKTKALRRAARRWVADHAFEGGYRIDVVSVADGKVVGHIQELAWE
ncbi:MAG: YraN family protein [Candidatus Peregrinibacteria bacterium]